MFKCVNKGTRTTFPSSLNIPTLFNIIDVSTTYNSMTVEWTAPAQGTAVGYKVYDSANNFMGSIAWPATGMTVTDLDAETAYTLNVVTYDGVGNSADSNTDIDTTLVAPAALFFSDGFETGNLSTTNADGFTWSATNRTSIVTQDAADGPVLLFEAGVEQYTILPDFQETAFTTAKGDLSALAGDNSLRFRYRAEDCTCTEPELTEQRFDLNKGYPEVWFSYHIRVPNNYEYGPDNGGAGNLKWMLLTWGTVSQAYGGGVTWVEVKGRPNTAGDGMNATLQVVPSGTNHSSESTPYVDFILPADAGRWMEIVYHLKSSSAVGVNDGVVQMYRKWSDESVFTYITGYNPTVVDISATSIANGYDGFGGGYFLGWADFPYAEETEFLIDNVKISTADIFGVL